MKTIPIILSLISILFISSLTAQTPEQDSLQQVIDTKNVSDSLLNDAYNRLVFSLGRTDSDRALKLSNKHMQWAKDIGDKRKLSVANYNHAVIYRNMGKYHLSLPYIQDYLAFRRSEKDTIGMGHGTYQLALLQRLRGQYDEAMANYNECIDFKTYLKDTSGLTMAINGRAILYRLLNQHQKSREEYLRALDLNVVIGSKTGEMAGYQNIGNSFMYEGKRDSALVYYLKHQELADKLNSQYNQANAHESLGQLDLELEKYPSAINHFEKAIEIRKEMGHLRYLMTDYRKLGEIHLAIGKLNPALAFAKKSLELALKNDILAEASECQKTLAKIYKARNDYKNALYHHEEFAHLRDSVLNDKITGQLAEMDAVYETQKKEAQIADLEYASGLDQLRLSQQKTALWIGSGVLLLLMALLYSIYRQKKQISDQKDIIEKALQEKDVLIKEIHHRVKNNLQVISSLLSIQSRNLADEKAIEALNQGKSRVQTMSLIHQDLYQHDQLTSIRIKKYFNDLVHNLFNTYNISKEKINISSDIQDLELDVDTVIPLGLIINELITNALKYAFPRNAGNIYVRLWEGNKGLHLIVRDNGIGITDTESLLNQGSYGYELIEALVDKLDGNLHIDGSHGTKIEITFKSYHIAA